MQDKYVGDIGDFGKYALLRRLEGSFRTGINWYRVPNENRNDGEIINYLKTGKYRSCDAELFDKLKAIVENNMRSTKSIEVSGIFSDKTVFFSELLQLSPGSDYAERLKQREQWHKRALNQLKNCEIVFLDPDNGIQVKSVPIASAGKTNGGKYVSKAELEDWFRSGKSVILYNHRGRQKPEEYYASFRSLAGEIGCRQVFSMCYHRGTARDYFFFCREEHYREISGICKDMVRGPWGEHFTLIE